ncbi:hypothetical protein ASG31_16295 [Chryseobacterium sp. Leaf404]|uniref:hypothetical protein n=1 Tax=unclassified Chryseobacterium TaxID=2593645 RepID=UPI0007016291|nr:MULTISPECIES: hypothetical protein [unclassified Chryseobacterium]KQT21434.1 hypothetical protein ASG31_16295 [Chryseobacterium sp. Leaf404]
MKNKILISTVLFLLINCKKQQFNEFDFSYGNTFETDFSIKFSPSNDSVFIREHWSANDLKKPVSQTNYVSQLNKLQKKELDSFIQNINFKSFDTIYFENYQDGNHSSFFINKDGLLKKIIVHSDNAPKSLTDFAAWIYNTKKSLKLIETQRKFDFRSKTNELEPPKAP